jgi:hypothetical protein
MKEDVKEIIEADETAWDAMVRAQAEAARIKAEAQRARSEADIYLERLRARKEEVRADLVDRLLHMVTGQ